jgi:hypothetical protein
MCSDGNLKEVYGEKIDLQQIDRRKWKKCWQAEEMTGYERIVY